MICVVYIVPKTKDEQTDNMQVEVVSVVSILSIMNVNSCFSE